MTWLAEDSSREPCNPISPYAISWCIRGAIMFYDVYKEEHLKLKKRPLEEQQRVWNEITNTLQDEYNYSKSPVRMDYESKKNSRRSYRIIK